MCSLHEIGYVEVMGFECAMGMGLDTGTELSSFELGLTRGLVQSEYLKVYYIMCTILSSIVHII